MTEVVIMTIFFFDTSRRKHNYFHNHTYSITSQTQSQGEIKTLTHTHTHTRECPDDLGHILTVSVGNRSSCRKPTHTWRTCRTHTEKPSVQAETEHKQVTFLSLIGRETDHNNLHTLWQP